MRIKDRDNIVELIATIVEAIDYCLGKNDETAFQLLDDCGVASESILNTFGLVFSDQDCLAYSSEIKKLEKASNIFYNPSSTPMLSTSLKAVRNDFIDLSERLSRERIQYEIIFLPYKAAMWDSMESIWLTAKEDPNCIPYVIPIPYYEKNRDGFLGEDYYDGELFPEYVPITHYLQYDMRIRRPDIIYFHNPYDRFNKITSVHPMYYSDQLKQYTDMLVYIPYFTVIEHLSEDFAILPGVRYADKVIVQSEQIANEYRKFYPGKDKDKFLSLGSPKFDQIIAMNSLRKEDLNLPEEWKNRIGNRKVILYNTHLHNIMNCGEDLLKKLPYVFACFENQEDAVLLWRPHPLSGSTLAAINPDILERYNAIVAEYKQKEIGLFDDTPDLHRTLALADAYYGDGSSLVALFGVTGKPIMLQDVTLYRENDIQEIRYLSFMEAYTQGNDIWFSANEFNGLFHMDLRSGKVNLISHFPDEIMKQTNLYCNVIFYQHKLMFLPYFASELAIYNLQTEELIKVSLPIDTEGYKYRTGKVLNNWLYMLPCGNYPCLKVHLITYEIVRLDAWDRIIRRYCIQHIDGYSIFSNSLEYNDKLYAPLNCDNILFEFDLKEETIKEFTIGEKHSGYFGLLRYNDEFVFLPREKESVVRWNSKTGEVKHYDEFLSHFSTEKIPFFTCCVIKDKLWLFARNMPKAVEIDLSADSWRVIEFDIEKCNTSSSFQYFSQVMIKNENELLLSSGCCCQIIHYNIETGKSTTQPISIDEALADGKLSLYLNNNITMSEIKSPIYQEDRYEPLCCYIKNITVNYDLMKGRKEPENTTTLSTIGCIIHNRICSDLIEKEN